MPVDFPFLCSYFNSNLQSHRIWGGSVCLSVCLYTFLPVLSPCISPAAEIPVLGCHLCTPLWSLLAKTQG